MPHLRSFPLSEPSGGFLPFDVMNKVWCGISAWNDLMTRFGSYDTGAV